MTRRVVAGAWWGDYLPSGDFVATIPGHGCDSSLGHVPMPPGESFGIGYPRLTDVNGVRFAGQAHDTTDPACWEYDPAAGGWVPYAPPCCGVSPVIYDRDGVLHRSDCGPGVGSQGYRYCSPENVLVTGDQTYGPFHGLFEYTQLAADLWIGQAAYDGGGVQVWDGTVLRQLELGDCRFLRANRVDDIVALAFTRPEGVVLLRTTMQELRALPPVVTPEPPEPPTPNPEPPEPPEPGPEPPGPTPDPYLAIPMRDTMTPFAAALRLGAHFCARVDPTPGLAPWTGWFIVRFDRTDPHDPDCRWDVSKPDAANSKLRARHVKTGATLTMDFTEFGGNVCQGFYGSPESAGWFGYQQLAGWQLGPGGVEIVTVDYTPAGTKAAAPCLSVVRL